MNFFNEINKEVFYPLTHPQKRIWYIEKINPSTSIYNLGGPVRIKGSVNFSILEKSINVFIKKNDGLRLRFIEQSGQVMQYVNDFENFKIDFFDFSKYINSEEEFQNWVNEEIRKPFVLEDELLFYFSMFKITDNDVGYFVKFHHIISDGWSMNIMTEQICDTYMKILNNDEINEEVENSYLEYIYDEEEYLNSKRFIKNKVFWNEKFNELPETFLHKSSDNMNGERLTFLLEESLSTRIKQFVSDNKCSINTFFVSIFLVYLSKVTSQQDIIIGTPVLNRSGKKQKSIFGMFTSTMPLRVNVDIEYAVVELINQVNKELKSCFFNQKYPYDILVGDLELKKKGFDNLFQVCVNYYNTKLNTELNGASIENVEQYNGNQLYSLQLVIKEWSTLGSIMLNFDYKVEDYTKEEIEDMYSRLNILIDQILDRPDWKINELDIISEKEKNKLIYECNSTESNYPKDKTIYELFEEQVKKIPDNVAVEFKGLKLTYKELNEKANQLARYLRKNGVERESIVGLMVTHSIEMVIGILGIIKAGGAYLPVDPNYPIDRINYLLEDSGANILLTNCNNKEIKYNGKIIQLSDDNIFTGVTCNLELQNKCSDLVYIIYTSGSTGKPKGTMIEHSGLVNYIWWAKEMYVSHDNEVFALYSSLSFDLTVTSIFTPLISGNSINVYCDDGVEYVLYQILRENKSTIVKLTPAHLSLIKEMDNSNSSIKKFIVGGEDLKVNLAASIHKSFKGDIRIFNEYGPTETVVGCMIYEYNFKKDVMGSVSIGVPANNVQIYILDNNLKVLPKGSCGEMYISGDGVARGYLNREELTAERFIENPFISGKRMYRTGDLARFLDDFNIEYLGRVDHQVKIRGYRIELGEIEKHLLNITYIQDTLVIDLEGLDGNKYLCAYIVASEDFTQVEIQKYLLKHIPEYMIPAYFIRMEKLPLTSNGKVDRNLLPKPQYNENEETECTLPRNQLEEKLLTVVKEVLGLNNIGMNSNFYSKGGDSIKAIQIAAKLNECGLKIKVKDILSNAVIEEMLSHLESTSNIQSADQNSCEGFVENTPITAWFFSRNFNNVNHWHQSVNLELKREIDLIKLQDAINMLIKHHDSLRLNYNFKKGQMFYNSCYLDKGVTLKYVDLSSYSREEQNHKIKQIGKEVKAKTDIEKNILFAACVFDLGNKRNKQLLLTAHHLVVDGVSWRILLDDLSEIINNINDSSYVLPLKTHSIQEWAEKQVLYAKNNNLKEKSYWDSISRINFKFPTDFNCGNDLLKDCRTITQQLSIEETSKLIFDANKAYSTKTDEILIIALVQAIKSFTTENEIIIELEGHGREELFQGIDISRTVGWFTSIYPVCINTKALDKVELIKSIKEQLRAIPNNGIGYGILKYLSGSINEDNNKHIRFNFLGDFDNSLNNDIFGYSFENSGEDSSKSNQLTCLIDINSMVVEKRLNISMKYSRNKFKDDTIIEFMNEYKEQLNILITHCSSKEEIEYTPSDFETIDVSQTDLDSLFS